MSFSESLDALMTQANISNLALSKAVGTTDVSIMRWRKGNAVPSLDNAVKIAEFFGVSLDQMSGLNINVEQERYTRIPVLGDVSAGTLELANLLTGVYISINRNALDGYPREECFALRVSGDSMEPNYPDRSYVIVHQQQQCHNGEHVIVLDDLTGENTFKRYERFDDRIELIPLNDKYKPLVFRKQEINRIKIQGVAIGKL